MSLFNWFEVYKDNGTRGLRNLEVDVVIWEDEQKKKFLQLERMLEFAAENKEIFEQKKV